MGSIGNAATLSGTEETRALLELEREYCVGAFDSMPSVFTTATGCKLWVTRSLLGHINRDLPAEHMTGCEWQRIP